MKVTRRHILSFGTVMGASAAAALGNLRCSSQELVTSRFGGVLPDPKGILDLAPGFSYRVLMQSGDRMSDGRLRRAEPDGMAAFAGPDGTTIVMVNHELDDEQGGVSRMVLDSEYRLLSSNDVLTGTSRNCAGGPTPSGDWLSCEEWAPGGRVHRCPIDTSQVLDARVEHTELKAYGQFRHEAICLDPTSGAAYLTEDDGESALFRAVPEPGIPFSGELECLVHATEPDFDTGQMLLGESIEVTWKPVEPMRARESAQEAGRARIQRGEGIWFGNGDVYFTATTNNQLFRLQPAGEGGTLEVFATDLVAPDNITISPWGDIFVAEDQGGHCRLRIVDSDGGVADFARNSFARGEELAGVCFSPQGDALFINLQKSGHTLVVVGPFDV